MNTSTPTPTSPTNEICDAAAGGGYECDRRTICTRCLESYGCMIDSRGFCVTQANAHYDKTFDYTRATTFNVLLPAALTINASLLTQRQYWQFRAGDATYCPRNDTICQQCTQAHFWTAERPQDVDSRYCVGANGCVCILNCEFSSISTCAPSPQDTPSPSPSITRPAPPTVVTTKKVSTWTGSSDVDVGIKVVLVFILVGIPLIVGYRRWSNGRKQKLLNDGFVQSLDTPETHDHRDRPPQSLPVEP